MTSEAKKLQKKRKKMHDYGHIYSRGLQMENEGRTTEASYPRNIFKKFPSQNWNQFRPKSWNTQCTPNLEKNIFFFYILTNCHISAEVHRSFPFCERSCLNHVSSLCEYDRDISNGFGLVACTPQNRFCYINGKKMMFKDCRPETKQQ